eukprot:m51a1_g11570 putative heat shock protein er luminal (349) ;mRNA; r:67-3012
MDLMEQTVGIDLGATFSVVGNMRPDKWVDIISNDQGNRATPSVVAFTEKEILVGQAALDQLAENPENTVIGIKRLLGRTWEDEELQRDIRMLPYKVVNHEGRPWVEVSYRGRRIQYSPEEIGAMILERMKRTAEVFLHEDVKHAVIACPVDFTDSQRLAIRDAARIAGLGVLRVMDEPKAVVIARSWNTSSDEPATEAERTVLVCNLGGGAYDVSLMTFDGDVDETLATGAAHYGGEVMDQRIAEHMLDVFRRQTGKNASHDMRAMQRLRHEAERLKRTLSTQARGTVEIDDFYDGLDFSATLSRWQFEELCEDLFQKTVDVVRQVLAGANQLLKNFFDGRDLKTSVS